MMLVFPTRRRARHPSHDCAGPGVWFLTINTCGKLHLFGRVVDGQMLVNAIGRIVRDCWAQVPEHFSNVRPEDFVVMPDHMHALLSLTKPGVAVQDSSARIERFGAPVPGSVATVVRSFKSATTRLVRQHLGEPLVVWHPGFYDRRITDDDGLAAVRRYIADNPARWAESHANRRDGHGKR